TIAVLAVLIVIALGGSLGQIAAIVFGAVAGYTVCRNLALPESGSMSFPVSRTVGIVALCAFFAFLAGLPLLAGTGQPLAAFDAFYRAGALVFGGGNVVFPLLEAETVARGWITGDSFLAGYGAAQAVPGPLFPITAYLGA